MKIKDCRVFLFQGDSVTECGRNVDVQANPNDSLALGWGYAGKVAGELLNKYPERKLACFNRGISGNRVTDLYARWKPDAIHLKPDCLSILVGINDTWHEFAWEAGIELDRYEQIYRMMLQYTLQRLPDVQLVLCEPFVLPNSALTPPWVADLDCRREIVARLAKEFGTLFVPFQTMFNEALKEAPPEHWAYDGIHPTPAGHTRMARFWRDSVGV